MTDPATGETIDEVPEATTAEVDAAVSSAAEAFGAWRRVDAAERLGVSEVGSSLLATGYQQVRSVVAALAGTGPAPPNATRGRWPRQCAPPTETCSPSPAAANSPGPSPSAHRDGGGRQRVGLEHTGPCQALTSRPASGRQSGPKLTNLAKP
jgi:hypothetical protein